MKRYAVNKSLIKTMYITLLSVLLATCMLIMLSSFTVSIISISFTILISAIISFLMLFSYYYSLKKTKEIIAIDNGYLIHESKNKRNQIKISEILKMESDYPVYGGSLYRKLIITYQYDFKYEIEISKVLLKTLENELGIKINFIGKKKKANFKATYIGYKDIIIGSLTGIILSVSSIILYHYFKNEKWLVIILAMLCLFHAGYQGYSLYIKDKSFDKISKLVLTILFLLLFETIMFTAIIAFSMSVLKKSFTIDYLFYAIFLAPSFLIIIISILLLLVAFSYA